MQKCDGNEKETMMSSSVITAYPEEVEETEPSVKSKVTSGYLCISSLKR